MGMKEPPARKGNAASKGQQQTTDQTDKKIGNWRGGALGDNAGSSDTRKGRSESQGASPKDKAKTPTARTSVTGSSEPGVRAGPDGASRG
jgi:hypothetical protein